MGFCSLGLGFLGSYRRVTTCTSALVLNILTLLLPFLFMPFYWWLKKEWMEMSVLGFLSLTRALVASMWLDSKPVFPWPWGLCCPSHCVRVLGTFPVALLAFWATCSGQQQWFGM